MVSQLLVRLAPCLYWLKKTPSGLLCSPVLLEPSTKVVGGITLDQLITAALWMAAALVVWAVKKLLVRALR